MRLFVSIAFSILLFVACDTSQQKKADQHPELSNRAVPDGYKNFVPFNNGYEIFFPADWKLVEKAKHEYINIVGPKPQSSSDIKPTINVTMKRGKARFKENAEAIYLPFEFEDYSSTYFESVAKRMTDYKLIEMKEEVINQSKTKSIRFTYSDPETDLIMYEELVLIGLPFRMYTLNLSCLNDELFRNRDHFEVVRKSFLGKAREDGSF